MGEEDALAVGDGLDADAAGLRDLVARVPEALSDQLKDGGRLADIAPTILRLMDLEKPGAMTGDCLIQD